MQHPFKKAKSVIAGFTLIEVLVVLSIFVIMTAVFIMNYRKFGGSLDTANLVYDVALSIREAQTYGIAVKSANDEYKGIYGIHFEPNNYPTAYFLYSDVNGNRFYDSEDDVIKSYVLNNGFRISAVCKVTASGEECPPGGDRNILDVTFKRPNPEAHIAFLDAGEDADNTITDARVKITSRSGETRSVRILKSGQISTETPAAPAGVPGGSGSTGGGSGNTGVSTGGGGGSIVPPPTGVDLTRGDTADPFGVGPIGFEGEDPYDPNDDPYNADEDCVTVVDAYSSNVTTTCTDDNDDGGGSSSTEPPDSIRVDVQVLDPDNPWVSSDLGCYPGPWIFTKVGGAPNYEYIGGVHRYFSYSNGSWRLTIESDEPNCQAEIGGFRDGGIGDIYGTYTAQPDPNLFNITVSANE